MDTSSMEVRIMILLDIDKTHILNKVTAPRLREEGLSHAREIEIVDVVDDLPKDDQEGTPPWYMATEFFVVGIGCAVFFGATFGFIYHYRYRHGSRIHDGFHDASDVRGHVQVAHEVTEVKGGQEDDLRDHRPAPLEKGRVASHLRVSVNRTRVVWETLSDSVTSAPGRRARAYRSRGMS